MISANIDKFIKEAILLVGGSADDLELSAKIKNKLLQKSNKLIIPSFEFLPSDHVHKEMSIEDRATIIAYGFMLEEKEMIELASYLERI